MRSQLVPTTLLVAAALFTGCVGRNTPPATGPVTIDIAANHPTEQITLQTIAEVDYIPLSISPEVLLTPGDRIFHFSSDRIMIRSRNNVFVFSRSGEIVSHFNRQGRGPGEYTSIVDIVFDEAAGEIFLADVPGSTTRIMVYSLAGEHKRTLTLPVGGSLKLYDFDARALLTYDDGRATLGAGSSTTPYRLISKTDGSLIETLAIDLPERYSNLAMRQLTNESGQTGNYPVLMLLTNKRTGGSDFTLADPSSDTVYRYTRTGTLTPAFVRTPSVHATEPRVVWGMELITDKFVVFEIQTLDFDSALAGSYPPIRSLRYDYSTGRATEVKFIDANNPSTPWSNFAKDDTGSPAGTAATLLNPLELIEAGEKGELQGPLAEIAKNIKEDANPVLMTVKFRQ